MKKKSLQKFSWENEKHTQWLSSYLQKKNNQNQLTNIAMMADSGFGFNLNFNFYLTNFEKKTFESFTHELDKTPGGRELWRQLYSAWEKKRKRSNNYKNNIKSYTLELTPEINRQLNLLLKGSTIKKTLEDLIQGAYQEELELRKNKLKEVKDKLNEANRILIFNDLEIEKLKNEIEIEKLKNETSQSKLRF
ncbi:MAG: hypothetical protein ACI88H_000216 [Cocleimonas sp.]|jgi:hypothetical protein